MFVMFFRASSRQTTELQKALSAMKKNDKVVTSGGILGVVVAVKENEDEVTLKVDETSQHPDPRAQEFGGEDRLRRSDGRRSQIPVILPLTA